LAAELIPGSLWFTLREKWQREYNFQGLINALTKSNGFCGERGKRWYGRKKQGPMVEKCHYNFNEFFLGSFIYNSSL
jgi:hypothetical protein